MAISYFIETDHELSDQQSGLYNIPTVKNAGLTPGHLKSSGRRRPQSRVNGLTIRVVGLSTRKHRLSLTVVYLFVCLTLVSSSLVEFPQNTVALLDSGHVEFKCRSDQDYRLKWLMQQNASRQVLFNGYSILKAAKSFSRVENGEPGKFYLNLTTKHEAAQTYICQESGTKDEVGSDLIIIESETKCEQKTNDNHVTMTCYIEFRGNWAPELVWSYNGTSIADGVSTSTVPNKLVSSSLVISPNATGRYACTTRFDIRGKPEQTTSTNVPSYIHKSILTVEATQESSDETESHSAVNGISTSVVIGLVLGAMIIILAVLIVIFIYRRTRRRIRRSAKGAKTSWKGTNEYHLPNYKYTTEA